MRLAVVLAFLLLSGSLSLAPAPTATWIWHDATGNTPPADAVALLEANGAAFHVYEELSMVAFVGPASLADALARTGRVDANEAMDIHLDKSVAYIEADRVRKTIGASHDGPSVMVVDTGIDDRHPDFELGKNLAVNLKAMRLGGLVVGTDDNTPVVDSAGHGTHVGGIVAGIANSISRSDPLFGKYQGVYANGRVIGFQASVAAADADDARVDTVAALEAFDWALANGEDYDLRVITNSWGLPGDLDDGHAIHQATLRLYLEGILVTFSAGNAGDQGTLNKYCLAPWVLCVAAGDLNGARTSFSSAGNPPDDAKPWDHPDITAPGLFIRSTEPPGTSVIGAVQSGRTSEALYGDRSGTSMATPHVAATAGLLFAARPTLSPDQVMDILTATASPMVEDVEFVGSGYLNARKAYNLAIQTPGNLDAFLAGEEVKYAGARSGDDANANDAVTQGYNGVLVPGPTLAPPVPDAWLTTPTGLIVAALIGGAALLNVLAGIRFRKPAPKAVPRTREAEGVEA